MTCTLCPLYKSATTNCMDGKGEGPIMVIGEAPGAYEDALGEPFVGESGQLLRSMLTDAGIDPDKVRYTNAVRCRPPVKNGKQLKPSAKQISTCRSYILKEIEEQNPEKIVLLGDVALRSITRESGISSARGSTAEHRGRKVYPTFHPAYVLRVPTARRTVTSDLWNISRSFHAGDVSYRISEAQEPFTADTIAWDVETSYWQDGGSTIIQWSAASHDDAVVCYEPEGLRALSAKTLVTHNGWSADIPWAKGMGIEMPKGRDTMALGYLMDETQALSLEALSTKYLGVPGWKDEGHRAEPGSAEFALYNARDAVYTLRLHDLFAAELGERIRVADHIISPAFDALAECSRRGIAAVPSAVRAARLHFESKSDLYGDYIKSWGVDNPNSNRQLGALLVSQGFDLPLTDGGEWAVHKDALSVLDQTTLVRAIRAYKAVAKRLSNDVVRFETALANPDGRVHPTYSLWRTVTGRTNCKNPNVQNVARDANIRAMMDLPVQADYSAIEFRVAAWLAQEEVILEKYRENPHWDPHRWFAALLYGVPESQVTDDQRQVAKSANFGLLYMAQWYTLVDYARRTAGIVLTEQEARRIRLLWHRTFPGFVRFYQRTQHDLRAQGWVASVTGRRRNYGDPVLVRRSHSFSEWLRECVNFQVQSLAADIALLGLSACHSAGLPVNGFFHDAVSFDDVGVSRHVIRECLVEYPALKLKQHFNLDFNIPLAIEVKTKDEKWKI